MVAIVHIVVVAGGVIAGFTLGSAWFQICQSEEQAKGWAMNTDTEAQPVV